MEKILILTLLAVIVISGKIFNKILITIFLLKLILFLIKEGRVSTSPEIPIVSHTAIARNGGGSSSEVSSCFLYTQYIEYI